MTAVPSGSTVRTATALVAFPSMPALTFIGRSQSRWRGRANAWTALTNRPGPKNGSVSVPGWHNTSTSPFRQTSSASPNTIVFRRTFQLMLKKLKNLIPVQWERFTGWLDVLERRWESYWLKRVASATAFAMVAGFILLALYGPAVSVSYLVTAAGLLLVALSLLLRFKFLQDLATLSGVALAVWWYVQSLPGVFNPVRHVRFDAEPQTRRAEQVQQVFAGSSGLVGCAHMKCLEARCSRLSRRYSSSSKRSAMPGKTSPWPGSQRGALSEAG